MRDIVASVTAAVNGSPCSGHLYTTPDATETIGQRHAHHTQGGDDAHDQDHPACAAEKRLVFTIDGARRGRQPVTATPVEAPCPAFAWLRVRMPGGVRETGRRARAQRAAPTDLCGAVRSAPTQRRDAEAFVPATSSILTRRRFGGTANRSAAAPVALGPSAPDTARPRPRRGSGRPPRAAACSRKGMAGRRLQTSGGVDHDVPAARRPPKDRRCGEPLPARRRR